LEEHNVKESRQPEVDKHITSPGQRLCAYIIDAIIAIIPAMVVSFVAGAAMLPFLLFITYPSPAAGTSAYLGYSSYSYMVSEQHPTYSYKVTGTNNVEEISEKAIREALNKQHKTVSPSVSIMAILGLAFYLLYSTVCTLVLGGQTIGKKIMHIRVQHTNERKPTIGTFLCRELLGKVIINSIPVFPLISVLTILFTKEHKALHDMLSDTIVVEA